MKATTGEEFDPSYLRLIRDRLERNVPGAAELAALPFGLSGAFDEELSRWPVMERRPLLLWFGVFALSSKAIRLEWAESVLRVFDPQLSVDTESWRSAFSQKFNSAEPGEYALYHERIPAVVMEGEDWEYALKWLAVSDVDSACLEGLVRALAFGERWEQVASPETAMRTPGLEELVDLGDWGYA